MITITILVVKIISIIIYTTNYVIIIAPAEHAKSPTETNAGGTGK